MKKISGFCLALALLMIIQCGPVRATAAETTTPVSETSVTEASGPLETAPQADFGTASVISGCRTIEAQVPLGGTERLAETAQSAFVYEKNTGTVLHAFNADAKTAPGSLAMIVTAMVALENGNMDEEITINSDYSKLPAGALNAKLKNGEVMTLRDLMYCMVLGSANDAAISIAEHIAGNETSFVAMMNEYVAEIGCTGTKFENCHGQRNEGYTTARDQARIMEDCIRSAEFVELFAANKYTVAETNKSKERTLKSTNYLREQTIVPNLNDVRVTTGKQSYSASSGAHLVCTAEDNGMELIVVLLGASRKFNEKSGVASYYGNFEEAKVLLNYCYDGYKICRLLHNGQSMSQFTVSGGENQVVGQSHTTMDAILPVDATQKTLIFKYSVENGGLTAPIKNEQKIATLQIWYRTSCIAETDIYAMSSVRAVSDGLLDIQSGGAGSDAGVWAFLGIACLAILIPLALYLFINNLRRSMARRRRRKRRQSRRRSR